MGWGSIVKAVTRVSNFFKNVNPVVALVATLAISWIFRPKIPDIPDFGDNYQDNFEKGLLINKQSNDASIPVVYGERLVGGTRVFVETSGSDNTYLYIALVLSEGEINDITEIRIDDKAVTWSADLADNTQVTVNSSDTNFYKNSESLITVEPHYGTDGQSASSLLSTLSNWGSDHKLSGLAYLAIRFKWNQDVFSGVPKIQAKVQGKKVVTYDSGLNAQTSSYSTNPAWCLLDYLTNTRYGKGLSVNEMDLQTFYDASLVCETQVTPYSGGSDINIFDCNTALDTSSSIIENVRELLKGCRGYLPYTAGKYQLIIETIGTASITLTEDDIIDGYTLSSPEKNNKFNRVIVSYVNPDRNYQVDEVQFPPIDDSGLPSADQHANMKTADGGYLLEGRFDFQTITNPYQAEEMAEIILRRSRESLTLAINVAFNSYDLKIGDIVNITHSSLGFSAKPFRVLSLTFNEDFTIGLNLVEYQSTHYTWATKTQQATIPTTNLPNPFSIQPPASVTLSDQLIEYNDGTVIVALDIALTASPDSFVDYYQVEYKLSSDTNYIIYAQGSGLNHRVLNVIDQETYDVRVKAVNALGISSTYVSASRTIIGALALPSNVEEFACNVIGQEAHLSWKSIPDLDLAYYSIRFSDVLSGAEWANSVNLIEKVSRPATSIVVPARVGSYLIKAVDKLGNHSLNETVISSNISGIQNYNAVLTQDEHPLFLGVNYFNSAQGNFDDLTGDFDDGFETNLVVSDNKLRLDSKYNFDDGTGNFDDNTTKLFDSSPFDQSLELSGYYYFGTPIDIGSSQVCRLTASIKQTSDNVDVVFDSATGNFDDKAGAFDGDTPDFTRTVLQISTSTDNITYSSYRDFTIGEYNARYFLFRVLLESTDGSSTPVIEELSVTIDMVDRLFSGNDIVSGTGTYTVTFTNPYYSPNYAIGVTAQSMDSGDTFTITNKTVNGFNIAFKNSSNIGVSKTFDFLTKGY
jgi:hypothetical protein